jgi:hypothetical protein
MEEYNDAKFTEDILKEREQENIAIEGVLVNVQKISNDMARLTEEQGVKVRMR